MSSLALRLHRGVATLVMAITSISAAASNADVRRTGNDFLSPELRALQSDPTRNPAELWVERGRQLWHGAGAGSDTARSCQHCHADGAAPAAGTGSGPSASEVARAAARFPRLQADGTRLLSLEDQIRHCRARNSPSGDTTDTDEVIALSAWLHQQAKGMPIAVQAPGDAANAQRWQQHLAQGAVAWQQRIGRYNLACVHCHDQAVGATFRGDVASPGHPTGFPVYRLQWSRPGSVERRLRACFSAVQAEMPAPGDPLLRQLELYLKVRANGMPLDGPSIRR